jgi:hypothetical protein
MKTITVTDEQLEALNSMVNYLIDTEAEDFAENNLEVEPMTDEEVEEVDQEILSGQHDKTGHIYVAVVKVEHLLIDQEHRDA